MGKSAGDHLTSAVIERAAMTTCALGCSKNGLLRFFLIMTDSALNDKENFIVRCRMLSALFKKRRIETYA